MIARRSTFRKRSEPSGNSIQQLSSTTFFLDRCLGAYELPGILRAAGLRVEVHKDHFNSDIDDTVWISEVGKRSWAIITKDNRVKSRQIEVVALLRSGQPTFVLSSGNTTASENAKAILRALPDMLGCIDTQQPPFIAQITKSGALSIIATFSMLIKRVE